MYTLKIQKLLNQIERIESRGEQVNILAQAIQIADDNQDIEWGYDLRLELLNREIDMAYATQSLAAFAWILQAHDENPNLFNEEDFLWQYKWMMAELYDDPTVSRAQIEAALHDFETRLLRNGYGLRAIYNEQLSDALVQKDALAVQAVLEKVNSVTRDDMSDCEACEMDAEVSAILLHQGYEQAYQKALPLLGLQFSCSHVPLRTAVNLAYAAHKAGRGQDAAKLAEQAELEVYKKEKDSSIMLSAIKLSAYFASVDPAKAKEWFERYIPWADGPDDRSMFQLASLAAEAMRFYDPNEVFRLDVGPSHALYRPSPVYTASELAAHYRQEAIRLADLFDARNGNTNFKNQLTTLLV